MYVVDQVILMWKGIKQKQYMFKIKVQFRNTKYVLYIYVLYV